jgi:hypothetical protein
MNALSRFAVVVAVAFPALSAGGCTSVFPVGTFGWGHGATPLRDGAVRVQAGGGGGAGLIAVLSPVGGAGAGGALEYQLNQAMLLRLDVGGALQMPGYSPAALPGFGGAAETYPTTMLGAGYVGTQMTMSKEHAVALRVRAGGGAEVSPATDVLPDLVVPYVGLESKLVKSFTLNDHWEFWGAGGFGTKVPFISPVLVDAPVVNSLPAVLDFGGEFGTSWRLTDAGHFYASAQVGAVFLVLPTVVGNVQAGYTHTF